MSSVRIPRVPTYSGYRYASTRFRLRECHPLCSIFQNGSAICLLQRRGPYPKSISTFGLGSSDFARHYSRNRFYFLFLRVLRCFSSPGSPRYPYVFRIGYRNITCDEFPHSDICGSQDVCSSPQLFAACHVLLRRHIPRHPP